MNERPLHLRSAPLHRALTLGCTALLLGNATATLAQQTRSAEPFLLGVITVVGQRPQKASIESVGDGQITTILDSEELRRFNRDDVASALNLVPGVTLSTNSRNETMISVRGFDSRQVPLFIDGIPVYVPYDGYVDFTRFTTADLAAIQVDKGFSSVGFGPNTLGGAINLISRKPVESFEGDVTVGSGSGAERKAAINVGTNQGLWYLQAGASRIRADGFPLSDDFRPTATENGGRRDNARREDSKLSLKLGLTPNATDEYAISYYRQEGEKGQPPSTDPAAARYWRWPYWDKESVYFISNTALGENEFLRIRLYHDSFDNEVNSYTDNSYSMLKTSGRGSVGTGRSIYDDTTNGGSITLESFRFAHHALRLAAHYKRDEHRETDANGRLNTHHRDALLSVALEDSIELAAAWTLSLGAAHHEMRPDKVFSLGNPYTLPDEQTANDLQAGLFHELTPNARLYATVASKTRLPTLKDRYSQRLGTYIENPSLRHEESLNYELGYRGTPWVGGNAEVAIFYSDISDRIQSVANVSGNLSQMRNVGKVRASGVEFGLRSAVGPTLELGADFTYIDLENRSDPDTRLTDVPRRKLTAHARWQPLPTLELLAFAEHDSSRWASNTVELDGFTTLDLKAVFRPLQGLALEAGVANLSDKDYALADGFPAPGRTWFINTSYRF